MKNQFHFKGLSFELLRITEMAALASSKWIGRGDEKAADQAAVTAMRKSFEDLNVQGKVVIGEGERDQAPMLYIGEKVGSLKKDAPQVDIALDPLEGTTICARGGAGALSVLALAEKGNFLNAPDVYMEKIACGAQAKGQIHLELSLEENLKRVSKALGKSLKDLTVVILDRPRHVDWIQRIRKVGARVFLIGDGDVAASIFAAMENSEIDLLFGSGGAPEGVLSAAALKCLGGDFVGRLFFRNEKEKERAYQMGIQDLSKVYGLSDLVRGDVIFCATGVTDGPLLKGVKVFKEEKKHQVHSFVMSSYEKSLMKVERVLYRD